MSIGSGMSIAIVWGGRHEAILPDSIRARGGPISPLLCSAFHRAFSAVTCRPPAVRLQLGSSDQARRLSPYGTERFRRHPADHQARNDWSRPLSADR